MNKTQGDVLVGRSRVVTPAKAGVQGFLDSLDSRLHANNGKERLPLSNEDVRYV